MKKGREHADADHDCRAEDDPAHEHLVAAAEGDRELIEQDRERPEHRHRDERACIQRIRGDGVEMAQAQGGDDEEDAGGESGGDDDDRAGGIEERGRTVAEIGVARDHRRADSADRELRAEHHRRDGRRGDADLGP